jgi:nucleoside 2-deoxyribosyltransferase
MNDNRHNVYLAGPINGCTDAECNDWRAEAKQLLGEGWNCIDPMRHDYRGEEFPHSAQIVYADLRDIDQCGIVLVNAQRASWGTAMELFYAFRERRCLVVTWTGLSNPSPWIRMHSHYIASHLKDAVDFIKLP